jgi:hypothetical protein
VRQRADRVAHGENYVISAGGRMRGRLYAPGPWSSIEIRSSALMPEPLYEAQVLDRLAN